jgi:hypothetical protein
MTYPFDQIAALGKANGQLVVALVNIGRENSETYARIGGKTTSALVDQFKDWKLGTVPDFKSEPLTICYSEFQSCGEDAVSRIKSAFDEWQECSRDALTQAAEGQQGFVQTWASWIRPAGQASPVEPVATKKAQKSTASETLTAS